MVVKIDERLGIGGFLVFEPTHNKLSHEPDSIGYIPSQLNTSEIYEHCKCIES